MRESGFDASFKAALVSRIGGKCLKIADKAKLGLPDDVHLKDGIATYFEIKIASYTPELVSGGSWLCEPARSVNDLRQFEICSELAQYATLAYIIYHPRIRTTAVIPLEILKMYVKTPINPQPHIYLGGPDYIQQGKGVELFSALIESRRKVLYGKLAREYGS